LSEGRKENFSINVGGIGCRLNSIGNLTGEITQEHKTIHFHRRSLCETNIQIEPLPWQRVLTMNSPFYWLKHLKPLVVKVKRISIGALGMAFKECKQNPQEQARALDSVLDGYVQGSPSDQNALDIFKGEWSSQLPGVWKKLKAGTATLFEDGRILWAAEQLGGFKGQRIIELGPLEAGHTYMLESLGAESILAIEANKRAYLKCLIVKEILGLSRSRFLLGDFVSFLRENETSFDICMASGVLYHMHNPCELIYLMSKASNKIVLWTHFYDKELIQTKDIVRGKFSGSIPKTYNGFDHVLYKYTYGDALHWTGFCGGSSPYSYWMPREDILACLRFFGFQNLRIGFEEPEHVNGPCFAVVARRD